MSQAGSSNHQARGPNVINSTVIKIATQVGCLTLLIILGALILGIWLDKLLGTRPIIMILLMIGSMPMTWVAIIWLVNRSKQQILDQSKPAGQPKQTWEAEDSDKD